MSTSSSGSQKFGWKEALIGAAITLVVRTIAGVAVWYFTRDPSKSERLIYNVETPAVFSNHGTSVGLQVMSVRNDGLSRAEQVVIDVAVPANVKVINSSISLASRPSLQSSVKSTEGGLQFFVPAILPKDKLTLSLLSTGLGSRNLAFSVRSQQFIATREQTNRPSDTSNTKSVLILAAAGLAQFLVIQYFNFSRQRKLRKRFEKLLSESGAYTPGKNNVGFVMMHNDLLESAKTVFWRDLVEGHVDLVTIANYGALLALSDDPLADKFISASKWPGGDPHTQAVVKVNEFIVAAHRSDVVLAKEAAKRAISFSKGVASYFVSSPLLKRLIAKVEMEDFVDQELTKMGLSLPK